MNQLLGGVESLLSILVGVFVQLLARFIYLDPSRLSTMEPIWSLSVALYASLLGVAALSVLGLIQLFPSSSEVDPFRLAERAFAATIALLVVNPPGNGQSLFGKGLFAWAFVLVNGIQRLFLAQAGTGIDLTVSLSGMADGVAALTALVFIGYLMGIGALLSIATLMVLLGLRQLLLFAVYGLFPLLVLFWVIDVGPPKYANQVAGMAFKAAGVLLLSGILVSGLVGTSVTVIDGMGSTHGTGSIDVAGGPNVSSNASFGRSNASGLHGRGIQINSSSNTTNTSASDVNVTDYATAVGNASVSGTASLSTNGSSLASHSGGVAEVLTVVIAVVAMCFGGSSILGIAFSMAGVGSLAAGATSGLSGATHKARRAGRSSATEGDDTSLIGGILGTDEDDEQGAQTEDGSQTTPAARSETGGLQDGGDSFQPALENPSATEGGSGATGGMDVPTVAGLAGSTDADGSKTSTPRPVPGSDESRGISAAGSDRSSLPGSNAAVVDSGNPADNTSGAQAGGSVPDLSDVDSREDFEAALGDDLDDDTQDALWAMHEAHADEGDNNYLREAASGAVSDGIGATATVAGLMAGGPVGMVAAGVAVGATKAVAGSATRKHFGDAANMATSTGRGVRQSAVDLGNDLEQRTIDGVGKIRNSVQETVHDSFDGDKYA